LKINFNNYLNEVALDYILYIYIILSSYWLTLFKTDLPKRNLWIETCRL